MPGLIFDLNNQAHNNADQKRERNGQHFQIGTDFIWQLPSEYMIVTRKNRRTYNRNHAVHIEQNAMFTLLIFCFPAANHRYHSYPTSFFSNHLAVKNDSAANQASEMTNTSIIIQNAIAVL